MPRHHAADGAPRSPIRGQTIAIEQQVKAMDTTLKRMQVNGIELNVLFAGERNSGPTVLLVHGFPDDPRSGATRLPAGSGWLSRHCPGHAAAATAKCRRG